MPDATPEIPPRLFAIARKLAERESWELYDAFAALNPKRQDASNAADAKHADLYELDNAGWLEWCDGTPNQRDAKGAPSGFWRSLREHGGPQRLFGPAQVCGWSIHVRLSKTGRAELARFDAPKADSATDKLPPAAAKAGAQYTAAVEALQAQGVSKPTDRNAYDWLETKAAQDGGGDALPSFATWARKLRQFRSPIGEQKHKRRAGRTEGSRSIRRASDL